MIDAKHNIGYDSYPEEIGRIMVEHNLLYPEEEETFIRFIRGY